MGDAIDREKCDALCDSAYLAGLKHGWNCGLANDEAAYQATVRSRDGYLAALAQPTQGEAERLRDALASIDPQDEKASLSYGFTREQFRAAKAIEYRIFGPYQWRDQGDRAASMVVQICQALKDEAERAALATKEE